MEIAEKHHTSSKTMKSFMQILPRKQSKHIFLQLSGNSQGKHYKTTLLLQTQMKSLAKKVMQELKIAPFCQQP